MTPLLEAQVANPSGGIKFLLGPNGSGKSMMLSELTKIAVGRGAPTIAISNTAFDRFPYRANGSYHRLSPSAGRKFARTAFKEALCTDSRDEHRSTLRMIAKVLDYVGFEQAIVVEILPRKTSMLDRIRIDSRHQPTMDDGEPFLASLMSQLADGRSISRNVLKDRYDNEASGILNILKHESKLKKARWIGGVNISLVKEERLIRLEQASSGEISLLCSYAFIASRIAEGAMIFIDEPENSLHPRWQHEYCTRLLDLFYYYDPNVFIASHSPMIISGAHANAIRARVFSPPWQHELLSEGRSVDAILFEIFGVLAPASHYLSELVSVLLTKLSTKTITLEDANLELRRLQGLSYDQKQMAFLTEAIELAKDIANGRIGSKEQDFPHG